MVKYECKLKTANKKRKEVLKVNYCKECYYCKPLYGCDQDHWCDAKEIEVSEDDEINFYGDVDNLPCNMFQAKEATSSYYFNNLKIYIPCYGNHIPRYSGYFRIPSRVDIFRFQTSLFVQLCRPLVLAYSFSPNP